MGKICGELRGESTDGFILLPQWRIAESSRSPALDSRVNFRVRTVFSSARDRVSDAYCRQCESRRSLQLFFHVARCSAGKTHRNCVFKRLFAEAGATFRLGYAV